MVLAKLAITNVWLTGVYTQKYIAFNEIYKIFMTSLNGHFGQLLKWLSFILGHWKLSLTSVLNQQWLHNDINFMTCMSLGLYKSSMSFNSRSPKIHASPKRYAIHIIYIVSHASKWKHSNT